MHSDIAEFLLTGFASCVLIGVCTLVLYELLRLTWTRLPNLKAHPRQRVLMVVGVGFLGHIINIWIYGFAYYAFIHFFQLGTLAGAAIQSSDGLDFFSCLYFSAVTYSTIGYGDVTPVGGLRMITGAEALMGFLLIGWTVTFTYLAMEKFWELPHGRNEKPKTRKRK